MLLGKVLVVFLVMNTFFWVSFPFVSGVTQLLILLWIVLITIGTFISSYIHWKLNIDVVTKEKLICVRFHGLFNFSLEELSLSQVKSINLKQKGVLQNIFSYGNIYIASEFHEEQSQENVLILKNVWPAEKVLSTIKRQVDIFRNTNGME
jgi:hypothetical protein